MTLPEGAIYEAAMEDEDAQTRSPGANAAKSTVSENDEGPEEAKEEKIDFSKVYFLNGDEPSKEIIAKYQPSIPAEAR